MMVKEIKEIRMVKRGFKWVSEAQVNDTNPIEWATKEAVQESVDRINRGTPWRIVKVVFIEQPPHEQCELLKG